MLTIIAKISCRQTFQQILLSSLLRSKYLFSWKTALTFYFQKKLNKKKNKFFSLNLFRLFWKFLRSVRFAGNNFRLLEPKTLGVWTIPRWHVQRLAHPRHVRATETQRALNRSARDSDTRDFHGLSNGWWLCWLLLLQESTSHKLRRDIRRYRHCSSRCSGPGVWPPERGPRAVGGGSSWSSARWERKSRAYQFFLSLLHRLWISWEKKERRNPQKGKNREFYVSFCRI